MSGYLSGIAFHQSLKATSISTAINNVAEVVQAVDGTNSYLHRAYKRTWSLSWNLIKYTASETYPLATVKKLQEIYTSFASVSTTVFLGVNSEEYLVFFEPNSWNAELAASNVTMTNIPYYNVSFRAVEI